MLFACKSELQPISHETFGSGTRLRAVYFEATKETDLTPLATIGTLEYLSLGDGECDLTQLSGATSLKSLMLEGTQISDLGPLATLKA
jgi:hypothetical protein